MPRRGRRKESTGPRTGINGGDIGQPPVVADPTVVEAMLTAVRAGVPVRAACEHAGIAYSSHRRAMDNGASAADQADNPDAEPLTERQELYRSYRAEFIRARARVALVNVGHVGKAAAGGQLLSKEVRTYTDDEGREVTEVKETYSKGDWRAARFMLQAHERETFGARPERPADQHGAGAASGPSALTASEEVLAQALDRLRRVAAQHDVELPGGWDPSDPDHQVIEGEMGEVSVVPSDVPAPPAP